MGSELQQYRCPVCGGEVSFVGRQGKCTYCRNEFVLKEEKSSTLAILLNNANAYLQSKKFDDAVNQFTSILQEYPKDAEAAWGLAMSTYGISYVKDPATERWFPTCSRVREESILQNPAYLLAIKECAPEQRKRYIGLAQGIEKVQTKIKTREKQETPYDVFISFKQTDNSGRQTEDSAIARKIYDELTKRGIKTFFSPVSLPLGVNFESYIYHALYSCKFFILVATKEEYLNSAWVQNEWSRYESRMKEENLSGTCFAVFRGIQNALPPVFRAQGVDLSQHKFEYDILIADTLSAKLGKKQALENAEFAKLRNQMQEQFQELQHNLSEGARQQGSKGPSVANLLLRAQQLNEEGDSREARAYYKKALDIDPQNAEAIWQDWLMGHGLKNDEELIGKLQRSEILAFKGLSDVKFQRAIQYGTNSFFEKHSKVFSYLFDSYLPEISALQNETTLKVDQARQELSRCRLCQEKNEKKIKKHSRNYSRFWVFLRNTTITLFSILMIGLLIYCVGCLFFDFDKLNEFFLLIVKDEFSETRPTFGSGMYLSMLLVLILSWGVVAIVGFVILFVLGLPFRRLNGKAQYNYYACREEKRRLAETEKTTREKIGKFVQINRDLETLAKQINKMKRHVRRN